MISKTTYLISIDNGTEYIYGGTFRLGKKKYAKLTKLRTEAKQYTSRSKAVNAGKKFRTSCSNVNGKFTVEEEDGFQSWQY